MYFKDETLPDKMATELDIVEERVNELVDKIEDVDQDKIMDEGEDDIQVVNRATCYYYTSGTAPACNGKCQSNEFSAKVSFGWACITGQKLECSNCSYEPCYYNECFCNECKAPDGVETKTWSLTPSGRESDIKVYITQIPPLLCYVWRLSVLELSTFNVCFSFRGKS